MKTLYVTDLDGTLLDKNEQISDFTISAINTLVENGLLFSFATARSYVTAGKLTAQLTANFPVILYNGAFIMDNKGEKIIKTNLISDDMRHDVLKTLIEADVYPLVYHYMDNQEKISFIENKANDDMISFLDSRQGDVRKLPAVDKKELYKNNVYYITCIDNEDKLYPLYQKLKIIPQLNCIYQKDIYSGRQWLEIMSADASKANAVTQLKELLHCDRVVCFGDGKNDISMFKVADECYAVENAVGELKQIATGVILSNNSDGVARWLLENGEYNL